MRSLVCCVVLTLLAAACDRGPPGDPSAGAASLSEHCPVTRPPHPPLTPPVEYTEFLRAGIQPAALRETAVLLAPGHFWYGNDALWLSLPADGMLWNTKQPWWRASPGRLSVQGRRLDVPGPAPPVPVAAVPEDYGERGFQAAGWSFPQPGCWEVVATVGGQELRFVVRVVPPPRP